LDHNYIKEVIEKYKPKQINLSGGEPLLDQYIYFLTEWLNKNKYEVNIYTSGFHDMSNFYSYKFNKIVCSLFSTKSSLHNMITGRDSFNLTIKNIKYLIFLKMNVEIHVVPMQLNLYDIDGTISDILDLGIKKVKLLKLVNQGRVKDNPYIIPDDYSLKKEIIRLRGKYGDYIELGSPFDKNHKCVAGKEKLVIQPNGLIIPCEAFKSGENMCQRI